MIIYDCEIIKAISVGDKVNHINYCDGWDDFDNMGIACIVFSWRGSRHICVSMLLEELDFSIDDTRDYLHSGFEFFKYAIANDKVIGFNSKNFDDKLCVANGIQINTHYDLLEEIRLSAYGSTSHLDMPQEYNYSLSKIAIANGQEKTFLGELAPIAWQKGLYKQVVDYCVNDVIITSKLLELGLAGQLIDPNTNKFLRLRSISEVSRRSDKN